MVGVCGFGDCVDRGRVVDVLDNGTRRGTEKGKAGCNDYPG